MEIYLTSRKRFDIPDSKSFTPEDMPIETALQALDVAATAKEDFHIIKGNEPLLYPFLEQFFDSARKRQVNIIPETSGLMPSLARELVIKNCQAVFLKVYRRALYSTEDWQEVHENVSAFQQAGLKLSLVAIVDDFTADYAPLLETAEQFGIPNIQFRLNCRRPQKDMKPFIKWYSDNLLDVFQKKHITMEIDCGVMFCSYTDEGLGRRDRLGLKPANCVPHLGVMPDSHVCHCWELTHIPGKPISTFKKQTDFSTYYWGILKDLQWQMHRFPECHACLSLNAGSCFGYSMATKADLLIAEYDALKAVFQKEEEQGMSTMPEDERCNKLWNLGLDSAILTRHADAVECFEELRGIRPEVWEIHEALGKSYWECNRYTESEDEFRKAARLCPIPFKPLSELQKRLAYKGNIIKARLLEKEIEKLFSKYQAEQAEQAKKAGEPPAQN